SAYSSLRVAAGVGLKDFASKALMLTIRQQLQTVVAEVRLACLRDLPQDLAIREGDDPNLITIEAIVEREGQFAGHRGQCPRRRCCRGQRGRGFCGWRRGGGLSGSAGGGRSIRRRWGIHWDRGRRRGFGGGQRRSCR